MSRVYSCMEDVACRTRTVTTVCSQIARKRHPSSLPYLLWMTGVHRLYQVARVLAALWTFLLLSLRKLLCVMLGRSQKSLRKVCAFVDVCLSMTSYALGHQCTCVCPTPIVRVDGHSRAIRLLWFDCRPLMLVPHPCMHMCSSSVTGLGTVAHRVVFWAC